MTNNAIIGFTAETFIHSGCGQSQGAIDQPFAREQATNYPYIPGSSLKGAFKEYARDIWPDIDTSEVNGEKIMDLHATVKALFGQSDAAGNLLISDLRLLLLPVRSLSSAYKWVTCPHILERLKRDLKRADKSCNFTAEVTYETADSGTTLFLEELSFKATGKEIDDNLTEILKNLCDLVKGDSDAEEVIIVSNDDFHWFARNALSIQARNTLNDNKSSENLWYEENLPPDTIMYCLLGDRNTEKQAVKDIVKKISKDKYLQTGGNETVGMGDPESFEQYGVDETGMGDAK
ncbi:CRISPR-associated RAMP Cmr4, partial [Bathymodiolus thermophilus thioautotrophic gill symbiont]